MTPAELEQIIHNTSWTSMRDDTFFHCARSTEKISVQGMEDHWTVRWPYDQDNEFNLKFSDPERYAEKSSEINPEFPVFYVEGYRLKLVFDDVAPPDETIKPDVVYVGVFSGVLSAMIRDASDVVHHGALSHLKEAAAIQDAMVSRRAYLAENAGGSHLLPAYECAIFKALGIPRATLLCLDFGCEPASRSKIIEKLLDVYRTTRNIVVNAYEPGQVVICRGQAVFVNVSKAICRATEPELFDEVKENSVFRGSAEGINNIEIIRTINTLFYLTKWLAPDKTNDIIDDDYIQPLVIEQLHVYCEKNLPLSETTMLALVLILESYPGSSVPKLSRDEMDKINQIEHDEDQLNQIITTHFFNAILTPTPTPTRQAPIKYSVSASGKALFPPGWQDVMKHISWERETKDNYYLTISSKEDISLGGYVGKWLIAWPCHHENPDDKAFFDPARSVRKLLEINPDCSVFYVGGYYLKWVFEEGFPSKEAMQLYVVYASVVEGILTIAMFNTTGVLQYKNLNEIDGHHAICTAFRELSRSHDREQRPFLSAVHENKIFQTLGLSRTALLFPKATRFSIAADKSIMKKVLDIYLHTRNIAVDATHTFRQPSPVPAGKKNRIWTNSYKILSRSSPVSMGFFNKEGVSQRHHDHRPQAEAAIETLLYLEKFIPIQDIKDEYIKEKIIRKLNILRINDCSLDVSIIENILMDTPEMKVLLEFLSNGEWLRNRKKGHINEQSTASGSPIEKNNKTDLPENLNSFSSIARFSMYTDDESELTKLPTKASGATVGKKRCINEAEIPVKEAANPFSF